MNKKLITIKSFFCFLLIASFCLFTACPPPDDDKDKGENGEYNNPHGGQTRGLTFSHASGLYASAFSLTMSSLEGTIYYSIDGSIPDPQNLVAGRTFQYTVPIYIVSRNGQPNLLATNTNTEQFYMVQDDPRGHAPLVHHPYDNSYNLIPKATVIRAVVVDSAGKVGDVVTRTFFIGDNLANYGNHPVISLVTDPFNLLDVEHGIYVRGDAGNRWNYWQSPSGNEYNFRLSGRERERETSFEYFDSSRKAVITQGAGIRVRGGWSRGLGQKSFNVYFRGEYGTSDLNYQLIPDAVQRDGTTPTTRYRDFILRNGGNDAQETKVRDVFIQSLLTDRAFITQAGTPCIVYLNGEYWGVYNMQERHSDRFLEYKGYANSRNNVVIFTAAGLDEGDEATDQVLYDTMRDLGLMDMTNPANYTAFCNVFDIDSYIDYFAAQMYIYNEDWPQNNYRIWRVRTAEPSNIPYGDTKWRFMMYDTEFSMGIYSAGSITGQNNVGNAFEKLINGEHKNHENARIFVNLMQNPDFAKQFVTTMMDLYNVVFDYNSNVTELDRLADIYRPIMVDNAQRWGGGSFDWHIGNMKSYMLNIRSAMVNNLLPQYFNISAGNLSNVTLSAKAGGAIMNNLATKINTVTPKPAGGTWTGHYYSDYPVTVTAADINGFTFSGWTVTGGTAADASSRTTTVTFTGNVEITANYTGGGSVVDATSISLNKSSLEMTTGQTDSTLIATVLPNNATFKTVIWTSSNPAIATVSNSGFITAVSGGSNGQDGTEVTITAKTADGVHSATCTVTVKPLMQNGGLEYAGGTLNFLVGDVYKFWTWSSPWDIPRNFIWASSDENVATVTQDGTVTVHSTGQTTISTIAVDGGYHNTCTINAYAGTTYLDLAKLLKDAPHGVKDTYDKLYTDVFRDGAPLGTGGALNEHVILEVINEGGLNKLKVTSIADWGAGIDIWDITNEHAGTGVGIDFQGGEMIEIRGKYMSAAGGHIILNMNHTDFEPLYTSHHLGEWWDFQTFIYVTEENAAEIKYVSQDNPAAIRVKSTRSIEEHWVDGTAIFYIEQLRVYKPDW
ncbi:MAG: CotH kinase family protein [Treponema sp.]|nr:CotH kinase family protein [Treponema sp.]